MKTHKTQNCISTIQGKYLLCLALSLTMVSGICTGTQLFFDFNTSNQLADNFYTGTTFPGFGTQVASGGLNNSGRVDGPLVVRAFQVTNQTFSALNPEITMSIYFKFGGTVSPFIGETLWLGIGRDSDPEKIFDPVANNNGGATGSSTGQSLQVGIGPRTSTDLVSIRYASVVNGFVNNDVQLSTASLTSGNWYYLEVKYSLKTEQDGYDFFSALYDSTSDGVVSETSLLSHSASVVNANLASGQLHAFFGGRYWPAAGAEAVDNFAVSSIPETSVYAMLGGIFALGFTLWHRGRAR